MSFNTAGFQRMHRHMLDSFDKVTLKVRDGSTWREYPGVAARVVGYNEEDLAANSAIEVDDMRVIILAEDIPAGLDRMEQKDRIEIDGRDYAVMSWDNKTRRSEGVALAVNARVRG